MKKIRVAVIGCGAIGQRRHLPEYVSRNDVELVAVVDKKLTRAKEAAETFGASEAFKDYHDALDLGVDAVSVCTPNYLHAPMAIDALKAKAHVLVEKPMAGSVAEARKMIAEAKKRRKQLMVAHNQRMAPAHVRGKEIYQSGQLGKCVAFVTNFAHGGPEGWSMDGSKGFFFKKNQAIIGALGDLGVHKIDLIRWFLEDEVTQVCAMCETLVKPKCTVDDTAFASLKMDSGILGQMFAGWMHRPGEDNSTTFYCEQGLVRMFRDPAYSVIVQKPNGEVMHIKAGRIQTNEAGGQSNSGVIDGFVDAIQAGRKVPIPGEEGARSLAAVLACLESAKSRKFVKPKKI